MAEGLDLGKKVGPLPLGIWIVVIAGGLGVAYFVNRGQTDEGPSFVPPETGGGVPPGSGGSSGSGDSPDPVEDTNDAWGREVTDWLIAQGFDPSTATQAVRKFLVAEQLSQEEQALVNMVLRRHGSPPEPLPPAPPAEPSKRFVEHVIQPGDTLPNIAKRYYGSSSKQNVRRIFYHYENWVAIAKAAREHGYPHSSGGKYIFPGTVLIIPGVKPQTTTPH